MTDPEAELAELRGRELNFDPAELPEVARDPWYIDDYCTPLAVERPGEPEPAGPFERARTALNGYEFADPTRVRAWFVAGEPLPGRTMLLEIRYYVIRVRMGVRISHVFEETREVEERPVLIRGWAYQTLEGHLERGQMDYQLWKWLDSGEVEFRIHAVSQKTSAKNLLIRLGFRLVGRRQQVRFARRCGERMLALAAGRALRSPVTTV